MEHDDPGVAAWRVGAEVAQAAIKGDEHPLLRGSGGNHVGVGRSGYNLLFSLTGDLRQISATWCATGLSRKLRNRPNLEDDQVSVDGETHTIVRASAAL